MRTPTRLPGGPRPELTSPQRERAGRSQSSAKPLLAAGTTRVTRATSAALLDGARSIALLPL